MCEMNNDKKHPLTEKEKETAAKLHKALTEIESAHDDSLETVEKMLDELNEAAKEDGSLDAFHALASIKKKINEGDFMNKVQTSVTTLYFMKLDIEHAMTQPAERA